MKIIICAKWTWENQLTVEHIEEAVYESAFDVKEVLLCDSDDVGRLWAEQENIPYRVFAVNWSDVSRCKTPKRNKFGGLYNPNAGRDRNSQLVAEADGMLLFWNEEDKNSEYLVKDLKKANKRVVFPKINTEFIF